jgi:predicted AAA+ superfamily ATPase
MDITTFQLSNPWRTGRSWEVPGIQRTVLQDLVSWIAEPEILILSGARQVGKTSILFQLIDFLLQSGRAKPSDIYYFNLDLASISEFLEDQGGFLRFVDAERARNTFVFIDEVQRLPDPGRFIKGLHDLRLPLKFILTGSSSLDIRARAHEALTGRKRVFPIEALSFLEYVKTVPALSSLPALNPENYKFYLGPLNDALRQYALYGGYPALVLSEDAEKKILRLSEIFSSYVEKDIAGFLKVENVSAFRKLATLLSAQQGGLVNVQELASTLGLHRETVSNYIHYLEETFVIRSIRPFFSNPRTELSKMPKIYFCDAGLRNLSMGNFGDLDTRSDIGQTMEGIVIDDVFRKRLVSQKINYWRTKSGAEVDIVVSDVKPDHIIEVKSGSLKRIMISRGLRSFLSKYSPKKAILLNSNLWMEEEAGGCVVQAVPTVVFMLGLL